MRKLAEGGELEADPAEVLGEDIEGLLLSVAVDADHEAGAGEVLDGAQFEESHQSRRQSQCMPWEKSRSINLPGLEVTPNHVLIEEDDHSLFVVLLCHEAAEADTAHIVPDLDPVAHQTLLLDIAESSQSRRVRSATRILSYIDAIVVDDIGSRNTLHTHNKRVLLSQVPLTKENSPQCLAEESLTLSRNGVCSPPSARPSNGVRRCFGGEGGTRRR